MKVAILDDWFDTLRTLPGLESFEYISSSKSRP